MNSRFRTTLSLLALTAVAALAGCERPPVTTEQHGYRGTGMVKVSNPRTVEAGAAEHAVPPALPAAAPGSPAASTVYKNVQVLGDLPVADFTRLMTAMTTWVSPEKGCNYCHEGADFASDKLYTKVVARRMLQMTRHINTDWKAHVADTGVTCYTCHRGQPVPAKVWFKDPGPRTALGPAGSRSDQNAPALSVGLASLPYDPFTAFLEGTKPIRVASTPASQGVNGHTIQDAEWTYGLMMHFSESLGVNCTYCHNSRAFSSWQESPPQRATAWHGIGMVRDLNKAYLVPLAGTYPPERLGPLGDAPKANCGTCHRGAFKPLNGASMLKDHPELAAAAPAAAPAAPAEPAKP